MGCGESKQDPEEGEEEHTNNPANIYYDNDGNLRHGGNVHDRDDELHKILSSDDAVEEDGKLWYVVDSAWAASWLEFVSLGKNVSPAPGPLKNQCLLVPNYDKKRFEPRPDLVMFRNGNQGHYKRISKEMWDIYCEFYPDSGPEIKMFFKQDPAHAIDCKYDTSGWIIDQSSYADYVSQHPRPKKKIFDEGDPLVLLEEDSLHIPTNSGVADKSGLSQQQGAGRMEDNTITDEQRNNLSIFLGGGNIEETAQTNTVSAGFTVAVRKPDRGGKTLTSDMWLFGAAPQ